MTSGFFKGDILRGLAARVLLFLSLALLPIGLIAIVQTRQINDQARSSAELSLLAVTERVSAVEERVLQQAFGVAEALGAIVRLRHHNNDECSAILREYREGSGIYALVGFIQMDGLMTCSSAEGVYDFSQTPDFEQEINATSRSANTVENGVINGGALTIVTAPVFEDATLIGRVGLSIPARAFAEVEDPDLPHRPLAMMTFNRKGQMLTSEGAQEAALSEVPADFDLSFLSGQRPQVFRAENAQGMSRVYAVLPLIDDVVYAVTVWPQDTPFLNAKFSARLSALLPIFMWVASLVVAFWALNRLAITHIRKLGRQMRRFAINRMLPRDAMAPSVPVELIEMERAFVDMAQSILRDEAAQEDSIREKNILLKEVHHRVKNNLQLISSIMNMQIRQAKGEDSKFVLRRLQERILSLATVHENLYRNDNLVRVDAGSLLHETVNQLLAVGLAPGSNIRVTQHYDPITLNPDDAAPLTLLASEAVTNALKYVSAAGSVAPQITVELRADGAGQARLSIENTATGAPESAGTGLGSKLITAFSRQLNGQEHAAHADGLYRLSVTFPVPETEKPVRDY